MDLNGVREMLCIDSVWQLIGFGIVSSVSEDRQIFCLDSGIGPVVRRCQTADYSVEICFQPSSKRPT